MAPPFFAYGRKYGDLSIRCSKMRISREQTQRRSYTKTVVFPYNPDLGINAI